MHSKFIEEWHKRWDQHALVEPGHWDPHLLQLVDAIMPQDAPPMELQKLDTTQLRKFAKSQAGCSDRARRSVSFSVVHMPDQCIAGQVDQVYDQAEQSGFWPVQLRHGSVPSRRRKRLSPSQFVLCHTDCGRRAEQNNLLTKNPGCPELKAAKSCRSASSA